MLSEEEHKARMKEWKKVRLSGKWLRDSFADFCETLLPLDVDTPNIESMKFDFPFDEQPPYPSEIFRPVKFVANTALYVPMDDLMLEPILFPSKRDKPRPYRQTAARLPAYKLPMPEIDHDFILDLHDAPYDPVVEQQLQTNLIGAAVFKIRMQYVDMTVHLTYKDGSSAYA
jgi:hypothetical protein